MSQDSFRSYLSIYYFYTNLVIRGSAHRVVRGELARISFNHVGLWGDQTQIFRLDSKLTLSVFQTLANFGIITKTETQSPTVCQEREETSQAAQTKEGEMYREKKLLE